MERCKIMNIRQLFKCLLTGTLFLFLGSCCDCPIKDIDINKGVIIEKNYSRRAHIKNINGYTSVSHCNRWFLKTDMGRTYSVSEKEFYKYEIGDTFGLRKRVLQIRDR